jgi:hypothetical protein
VNFFNLQTLWSFHRFKFGRLAIAQGMKLNAKWKDAASLKGQEGAKKPNRIR